MKKTIILIALALLLIVPVFAATYTPINIYDTTGNQNVLSGASDDAKKTQTDVVITLKQYPIYYVAVSANDISSLSDVTSTNYTTRIPHISTITLEADKTTWLITDSDTYYFSYFYYEYNENVKLSATLSGDLILENESNIVNTLSVEDKTKYKSRIRYQVVITNAEAGTTPADVTLISSGEGVNLTTILKQQPKTQLIGNSTLKSFAFVIKAISGETVQNNIAGLYTSNITLKVESY